AWTRSSGSSGPASPCLTWTGRGPVTSFRPTARRRRRSRSAPTGSTTPPHLPPETQPSAPERASAAIHGPGRCAGRLHRAARFGHGLPGPVEEVARDGGEARDGGDRAGGRGRTGAGRSRGDADRGRSGQPGLARVPRRRAGGAASVADVPAVARGRLRVRPAGHARWDGRAGGGRRGRADV